MRSRAGLRGARPTGVDRARKAAHRAGFVALLLFVFVALGCHGVSPVGSTASFPPGSEASFVDGYPAFPGGDESSALFHFVVEIPAGTNDKWEVDKATGGLRWEDRGGRPRVVEYLAYPGNYGMIPSTILPREIGGDGDPLDVLLLGPALDRGSVVLARPIALLRLLDGGERDDKILAVPESGPLSEVRDLATLDSKYRGVRTIVETWFVNYKGPGRMTSRGFADADEALAVVREASRYFPAK